MSKRYKITEKDIEIIQDFVDMIPYEVEYIEVEKSYRFECDTEENVVCVGSKRYSKLDDYFMKWLATKEKDFAPNCFVIALLHEVGHIQTKDTKKLEQRNLLDKIHNFMYDMGVITEEQLNFNYFEFPAEIEATKWAIDYYKSHIQECEELANKLGV